jgi:hypothetical protein
LIREVRRLAATYTWQFGQTTSDLSLEASEQAARPASRIWTLFGLGWVGLDGLLRRLGSERAVGATRSSAWLALTRAHPPTFEGRPSKVATWSDGRRQDRQRITEPIWWYRHSGAHSAEPLRLGKQTLCQLSYSRSGGLEV